ncbi:periplasmic protein [Escherichia coli DEC2B]|nr:periplasmic protein [Escherichia coli E128010]EHU17046.1 periplasmic protein [Escherichia coli DEC1C]EHU34588.1 periplasmic protein [Escherichia coli DEC2A]EHU43270.1 periplasmic protein [Escherichia coli DEC2B]EHU47977.1 periplasmic protein [Escherichia coli DEC2E]
MPDVDLEKYKDELLSYQELQRKNMMLKLQSENQKLESEIKKVDHLSHMIQMKTRYT